ncbi:MAG: DUF4340 domain-containing protein [Rudaea sp.]
MRKSSRNLLLLAITTAVIGAAVYAQINHERDQLRTRRLTEIDPASISHVSISCINCRTRRFERNGDGWHMLEPFALPASTDAVTRLIAVANAPVHEWLSSHDHDLTKLGLDPPQITLRLDDSTITIGNEDPIDHDRYMRIDDKLARVPDRFSARLLESPQNELADPNAIQKRQ